MFFQIFFLFLIHLVTSNSNQEDLSISNYYHIGCLTLNPNKQFITNGLQENNTLPYQTFSSPNMKIDLCFRLCRQWIILTDNNNTTCICLYTLPELYDINKYLGEVVSNTNCPKNALQIYSLTKDPYILPPPNEKTDDWSFEGCYRLDVLQQRPPDNSFTQMNYTSALTSCREHCQKTRNLNYFSFFLSFSRSCYCLPINMNQSINTTAIRKPLIHCSFLPYIKNGLNNLFNETSVHVDTVVKILVQGYCLSSFVFNRTLNRCFKNILVTESNSFSKITTTEECSPISVRTIDQYKHLLSLAPPAPSRTFIWINLNSTYLFDELFKSNISSLSSENHCLVIDRTGLSTNLVACSNAQPSDNIFCTQEPKGIPNYNQSELKPIETTPIFNNIRCPTGFILFDNLCYYVDASIVNNTISGERVCSDKYQHSSLIKFDSNPGEHVDLMNFLGREFDDILLEFFYYELEKKMNIEPKTTKDGLRLLIGDKVFENECVLRYFTRLRGEFITSHRCNDGGSPVCQCQPILIKSSKINFKLLLIIITISVLVLLILGGGVYYLRRNRELHSIGNDKKRVNLRRRPLPITPTSNETCDGSEAIYSEVETSPESIPMDTYIRNPIENTYITIEELKNQRARDAGKNDEEDDSYYISVKPH